MSDDVPHAVRLEGEGKAREGAQARTAGLPIRRSCPRAPAILGELPVVYTDYYVELRRYVCRPTCGIQG